MGWITAFVKGFDIDKIRNTFIPGSENKQIIDNFGITISSSMLDRWTQYIAAHNALFGTRLISRMWKKKIYPLLFPTKHKALCEQWDIERRKMQTEFLNTIKLLGH